MEINFQDLVKDALELNASHAGIADTSDLKFHEDFRKACEANVCRNYDTNWMGPPAIGPIKDLMKIANQYKQGLLVQTVHQLSSSFDWKGMVAAREVHNKIFRNILDKMKSKYKFTSLLALNAGCCNFCERCTYLDNEKCRFPDKAVSSVEAYGINVMALEKSAGIPYYNGKDTVSYVALILFNENN
jgi:predicted metal-binding protein